MSNYGPVHHQPPQRGLLTAFLSLLVIFFLFLIPAGALVWYFLLREPAGTDESAQLRVVAARGDLSEAEKSTIELFRTVAPSVVHVTGLSSRQGSESTGSGFVWDKEGRIVTNYHVIENASEAVVVLNDHTSWHAKLVGGSPEKDLAVL